MPRIIVYGTVCLDRFLLPGRADSEATEYPGGEAFNTAAALAGWGVPVTLTGTAVGSDAEGMRLRELLATHPLAQGIDISLVPFINGAVTPVCTVRVDENGERFMNGRGFKDATAPPIDLILSRLGEHSFFTVDPNLGAAAVEAAIAAADAGCQIVSLDCAALPEILAVSKVSVTSMEWIERDGRGISIGDAAKGMLDAGAKTAIVTQGAKGGLARTKHSYRTYNAAPIPPSRAVIDTTGAGDTFRAGLCWCLKAGLSAKATLQFASAAAALHCTTYGGGSRFSFESVDNLAAKVLVRLYSTQSNT